MYHTSDLRLSWQFNADADPVFGSWKDVEVECTANISEILSPHYSQSHLYQPMLELEQ
jgi:hypothetical protein